MLELYHWEPTSNSGEPLILLKEKGLAFISHYVDVLAGDQHAPEFLKINRHAQVPVLVHDGKVVTETGFILQYIEAVFPTPSFTPATAQDRYWVNVWIKYVEEYLAAGASKLGVAKAMAGQLKGRDLSKLREGIARAPLERQQAWTKALDGFTDLDLEIAKALLPLRLQKMEEVLATSDWLAGPAYSLADIVVFPTVAALPGLTPDLANPEATPKILAWLERVKARPAVKAALAMARTPDPTVMFAPGPEGSRWG